MISKIFKKETKDFFNKYFSERKINLELDDLEKFLMENYYLNISEFLVKSIRGYQLDKNTKILDIGCGSGDYLIFLNNTLKKGKYYGVDISTSAISKAKKNIRNNLLYSPDPYLLEFKYQVNPDNFKFYKTDGEKLPFDNNYFDIVYIVMVLHHTEKYKLLIEEAHRVLKENGKLIIIDLKGHNYFEKNFIKFVFKVTPRFIKKKIFKNDLILSNGFLPLRSDVSFSKINKVISDLDMVILKKEKYYSSIITVILLVLHLIYNKTIFVLFKPILYLMILLERKLRIYEVNYGAYTFVSIKK